MEMVSLNTFLKIQSWSLLALLSFGSIGAIATVKTKNIDVAITIDDLPASGPETANFTRVDVMKKIVSALKKNGVRSAYGFVNGITIHNRPELKSLLAEWRNAGFSLGNHTYSHWSFAEKSLDEFKADIEKNEPTLIDYGMSIQEIKVFRFPFLQEGETQEKRNGLRNYFKERSYRIAPVTLNFEDWAWGEPFARCHQQKDQKLTGELKELYLKQAQKHLIASQKMVEVLFGKDKKIPHILLLHATAVTGEFLDSLLADYKKLGVTFISLEQALKNPIFSEDTGYVQKSGVPLFTQMVEMKKIDWGSLGVPETPGIRLSEICK